jgi:hypothetical protein
MYTQFSIRIKIMPSINIATASCKLVCNVLDNDYLHFFGSGTLLNVDGRRFVVPERIIMAMAITSKE